MVRLRVQIRFFSRSRGVLCPRAVCVVLLAGFDFAQRVPDSTARQRAEVMFELPSPAFAEAQDAHHQLARMAAHARRHREQRAAHAPQPHPARRATFARAALARGLGRACWWGGAGDMKMNFSGITRAL